MVLVIDLEASPKPSDKTRRSSGVVLDKGLIRNYSRSWTSTLTPLC